MTGDLVKWQWIKLESKRADRPFSSLGGIVADFQTFWVRPRRNHSSARTGLKGALMNARRLIEAFDLIVLR